MARSRLSTKEGRVLRSLRVIGACFLLAASACDSPRPSPSPAPTTEASPAAVEPSTAASAGPSPSASQQPAFPSSAEKIREAVRSGAIDAVTGYVYRSYAQWGDDRLPQEYWGEPEEDLALAALIAEAYDTLPEADQRRLRPFIVRPTHDDSYWATAPAPATAEQGGAVLAAALADDPRCGGGRWARRDLVNAPVTIWAHCALRPDGSTELTLADQQRRAQAAMTRLWRPMTQLMGLPIPDEYRNAISGLLEVDEAGDGRLDVYLVEAPNVAYGRDVTLPGHAVGVATPAAPRRDGASAGYIVVDVTRTVSDFDSTIAHEFFHLLSMSHEYEGVIACPYPDTGSGCSPDDRSFHWFMEASATWAEHEFVPAERPQSPYPRFFNFLATDKSLADTGDDNEYDSFMWPLFMEQESPLGSGAIGDAWRAIESASGWAQVQAAVDAQQPFETTFRDFAVRVWNERLLPGDPLGRRFNAPALDANFPTTRPEEPDPHPRYKEQIDLTLDVVNRETVEIRELWAAYYRINLLAGAHRLTLNFAGLQPNNRLDVDALVNVRDAGWQRRELDPVLTELCLDKPGDEIEEVILVLSNHSQTPREHITGDWTAEAESTGCASVGEGLVYTSFQETGSVASGFHQTKQEMLVIQLRLKSGEGQGFVDDHSTHRASIDMTSFVAGLPGANCDFVSEGSGGAGGEFDPATGGGVNASYALRTQQLPGGGTQTVWVLSVAASAPVTVTVTEESCLGSTSGTVEHVITLPSCETPEVIDTDPAHRFEVNCSHTSPGWNWTLTGTVTISA
jgi:hypothetical protein